MIPLSAEPSSIDSTANCISGSTDTGIADVSNLDAALICRLPPTVSAQVILIFISFSWCIGTKFLTMYTTVFQLSGADVLLCSIVLLLIMVAMMMIYANSCTKC